MDELLFQEACGKVIDQERIRSGIGTLSEKTVHAVLKRFYEPDEENHEIPIDGYVADILKDGEIIEIQTRGFNTMRRKLETFLTHYHVTIVHPIPHTKWLVWVDEETGEMTNRRKSPKTGNVYQVFPELYKIKFFLKNPNLHFCFPLIDMEEQRLLNGWSQDKKKGSHRYDRIPVALAEEIYVDGAKEFDKLIPEGMPENFTTKDFAKAGKVSLKVAQTALTVLFYTDTVERVGKKGKAYLYQIKAKETRNV